MKSSAACISVFLSFLGALQAAVTPSARLPAAEPLQLETGKKSEEIQCAASSKWSYFVYLPKAYTADRKWPVMFIMSPVGGNAGTLDRYIPGAEMNGWILAVSVQSKNGNDTTEEPITAMVEDVCKRLPVDPKRIYSSGMSGGARMAFWLSEQMKSKGFAGVLACGAGGIPEKMSTKTAVFGLCGSNCFNRWDMACTFKGLKNDASRLRFFVGNHTWADAGLITYAMSWLNASYLKTMPQLNAAAEEKKRFIARVQEEIQKASETDPEAAYEWALCLSQASPSPSIAKSPQVLALMKNPKVLMYISGLKDLDQFVKKHFATNVMDYKNNNGTEAAKKDAAKCAAKYQATGLAELFTRMGEPAVSP